MPRDHVGEGAIALGVLLLCPFTALAQTGGAPLVPEVVVTATRLPTAIEEIGSSVTVITAETIEERGYRAVPEALRGVPGLHVVQVGGPGRIASVFARGANSNHTLVLVDGIEMSDPSAPNGAFNYSHLLTTDLDRIEVLRGPQSTLLRLRRDRRCCQYGHRTRPRSTKHQRPPRRRLQ